MQRYKYVDGASSKFWEIGIEGKTVTVRFGKIGSNGQTQVKTHASPELARKAHDKLVAEKTRRGYRSKDAPARPAVRAKPIVDGAPKQVTALRKIAAKAHDGAAPLERTYLLTVAKGQPGLMRAGGPPTGVTEATRPKYHGAFMHHLITLDLDVMPELRQHKRLARARAGALFISDAMDNDAFDEDTQETAVVVLTAKDLERGAWSGPPLGDPEPNALTAWPVDVPAQVFTFDRYADGVEDDDPMAELHDALMSACRAGGKVIHWSGDEADDRWLFQFNEDLVQINLGDAGTMYVFTDHAYWSGH
jgi:predicted DNA-binding WGR domain protein